MNLFSKLIWILVLPIFTLAQLPPTESIKQLKSIIVTKIDKAGLKTTTSTFEFLVENESARTKLSNYRTAFAGAASNFKLVEASATTAGKKIVTDPKEVKLFDAPVAQAGLTDVKIVSIPVNNIQIGSTVTISYQVREEALLSGHANASIGVSNSSLAKEESYRFESELPLKIVKLDFDGYFDAREWREGGKWFVEMKPLERAYATVGVVQHSAVLHVSTSPSWEAINKAFSGDYAKVINARLPPEMEKVVVEAAKLKSSKEQIEYATKEISKLISYSGNWTAAKGKYLPQDFNSLFKNKKGDCKDYSSLLVAVLKKLKFDAFPALTLRTDAFLGENRLKELSSLPALTSFNHVIVWAQDKDKKEWWIDPTNSFVFANVISPDILGNFSLVLDGKMQNIKFLPSENAVRDEASIEQTIKLSPDNSVQSTGKMVFNESSYNVVGLYEKLGGPDFLKTVLNAVLFPREKLQIEVTKDMTGTVPSLKFSYFAKAMIEEKEKAYKRFVIPNPVSLSLAKVRQGTESYIGEVGTFTVTTTFEKAASVDSYEGDCIARTPWMDVDRTVENKGENLVVTDTIKTKRRTITKSESLSENFGSDVDSLQSCTERQFIYISRDASQKTAADLETQKALGPPIQSMSEKDAEALAYLSGPIINKASRKLVKYYSYKMAKEPKNPDFAAGKAEAMMWLGYVSGNDFQKAFCEDALSIVNAAYELNGRQYSDNLLKARIYANVRIGNFKEAIKDVAVYSANEKNVFRKYVVTADVALGQKDFSLAEKWLLAAERYAVNDNERIIYHHKMFKALSQQKNKAVESLPHLEKLTVLDPKNSWRFHNLATVHFDLENYDKVIALEKQALAISEFGAAKYLISEAYLRKSNQKPKCSPKCSTAETKSIFAERESLVLEALKYSPDSESALSVLLRQYLIEASFEKDKTPYIGKINNYLQRLASVNPSSNQIIFFKQQLEFLRNPVKINFERMPASK